MLRPLLWVLLVLGASSLALAVFLAAARAGTRRDNGDQT